MTLKYERANGLLKPTSDYPSCFAYRRKIYSPLVKAVNVSPQSTLMLVSWYTICLSGLFARNRHSQRRNLEWTIISNSYNFIKIIILKRHSLLTEFEWNLLLINIYTKALSWCFMSVKSRVFWKTINPQKIYKILHNFISSITFTFVE